MVKALTKMPNCNTVYNVHLKGLDKSTRLLVFTSGSWIRASGNYRPTIFDKTSDFSGSEQIKNGNYMTNRKSLDCSREP